MTRLNKDSQFEQREGLSLRLVSWAVIAALISMLLLVGFHGHSADESDANPYCGICDLGHHVSNHLASPSLPLISVSYSKQVAVVPFFSIVSLLITSAHVRAPPLFI